MRLHANFGPAQQVSLLLAEGRDSIVEFLKWLFGLAANAGIIAICAYLFRDALFKFVSKNIDLHFEKRLEGFKAELRNNESELQHIRSALLSARRDHDNALQAKRLQAAEDMLRIRHALAQFSLLIEYMKVLDTDAMLKDGGDPKTYELVDALLKPVKVEEKLKRLGEIDQTLMRLYLSEKSLKTFETYSCIIATATMMMQTFIVRSRDKTFVIEAGYLSKIVIEQVPGSKEGFEKWGDWYAYYWATYFYNQILHDLRHEISGVDDREKELGYIENSALDARQSQEYVLSKLTAGGLSNSLIRKEAGIAASTSVRKATS